MSRKSAILIQEVEEERASIRKNCYPAFDDLLLYTLERRHLDVPEISDYLQLKSAEGTEKLREHCQTDVRLLLIDEIAYDSEETLHLPGVESALSAMRDMGFSIVFLVQGERSRTRVYAGVVRFFGSAPQTQVGIQAFESALKAQFPGSKFRDVLTDSIDAACTMDISDDIRKSKHIGVISGIPSLKRGEEQNLFVQGLERLIRSLRGKEYTWISIADPIPSSSTMEALEACRDMQSQMHHLVKTQLSKAVSTGKTVQLGMFGMMGQGDQDGFSDTEGGSETNTQTQNELEDYQRVGKGVSGVMSVVGGVIGTFIAPGIGTAIGSAIGAAAGAAVENVGAAVTGKAGHAISTSTTRNWAHTTSHAVSKQMAGGGFGSFGLSWTRTTTVSAELLNRKLEYAEELLQKYEDRIKEGYSLGMWNLGHYFCANDEQTYKQGSGVISSIFSGMESHYEPPRAIKLPPESVYSLQRFENMYFIYGEHARFSIDALKEGKQVFMNHPLGLMFNGPATPVNTKELAIAMPMATQDIEGVTVSKRASFGLNLVDRNDDEPTLTLGKVADKGVQLPFTYKLSLPALTKHLAVFGLTGSGKTNTVHNLLIQLWKKYKIPFMVVEPAKSEYRSLTAVPELKDDLLVISAGIDRTEACPLRLNPFAFSPGCDCDANRVHVLTHIDRLKSTFNSSFPMYASMPYILEEAILQVYRERGWDLGRSVNRYVDIYREDFSDYVPTLRDLFLKIDTIVSNKGYYQEQQMNIQAALKARLASLMVGAKGSMFNCSHSLSDEDLWSRPVIIELDNMGDDDEKAFLMGLLVSKLYEYRKTVLGRDKATGKQPKHILVIEEAHRLLSNVPEHGSGAESANVKGKAVSAFIDMLSEIRAMGEGVIVVDQLPSRVSPNIVKGTGAKIIHRLLAKDDRQAVGQTMGLSDLQIDDLCLLRTGDCVVSQDGDSKAFLCHVRKNDAHENGSESVKGGYTSTYKAEHEELFHEHDDYIGKENTPLHSGLYKLLMAVACGHPADDIKSFLSATCRDENPSVIYRYYARSVFQTVWNGYRGDYKAFLKMQRIGLRLFTQPALQSDFKNAAREYFTSTECYIFNQTGIYEGVLFYKIWDDLRIFSHFDRSLGATMQTANPTAAIAAALTRLLPLIGIHGIRLNKVLMQSLIRHLLLSISPNIEVESVLNAVIL